MSFSFNEPLLGVASTSTVGYRLLDSDSVEVVAYTNAGVEERVLSNTGLSDYFPHAIAPDTAATIEWALDDAGSMGDVIGHECMDVPRLVSRMGGDYAAGEFDVRNAGTVESLGDSAQSLIGTIVDNAIGNSVTGIAAAVWDRLTFSITAAGSIGKRLLDFVTTLVYVAPNNDAAVAAADAATIAASNTTDLPAMIEDGAFTEAALVNMPPPPTVGQISDEIDLRHGGGVYDVGAGGTGAFDITGRITDGTDPLAGATVRLHKVGYSEVITTESDGTFAFRANAGTYSLSVVEPAFGTYEDTVVVSDDADLGDIELTAVVITPSPDPEQIMVICTTRRADGSLHPGAKVVFELITPPTGSGNTYARLTNATSDGTTALLQKALLREATYSARISSSAKSAVRFTTEDADSQDLPDLVE